MKQYINISTQEQEKWQAGENVNVLIDAGTGTGKTTFVLNRAAANHNQRFLYLCNRSALDGTFEKRMKERHIINIDIQTYQAVETKILHSGFYDFSQYKEIFCDEVHYFLSDSLFNDQTHLSLQSIANTKQLKFWLSATPDNFLKVCDDFHICINHKYSCPTDYSYIDKMFSFSNKKLLNDIIPTNGRKQLMFINDKEFAKELKKTYEQQGKKVGLVYAVHDAGKQTKLDLEAKEIKSRIEITNTFPYDILISTSVLDNGIDIIDKLVERIVILETDIIQAEQMLGRLRFSSTEKQLNVIIYNPSRWQLYKHNASTDFDFISKWNDNGSIADGMKLLNSYNNPHIKNRLSNLFDDNGCIPPLRKKAVEFKKQYMENMSVEAFDKLLKSTFNVNFIYNLDAAVKDLKQRDTLDKITKILDNYAGQFVDKETNVILKQKLIDAGWEDKNNRDTIKLSTINDYIEQNNLPYISIPATIRCNGKQMRGFTIKHNEVTNNE